MQTHLCYVSELTCIIDGLVGLLQDLAGHRVHGVPEPVVYLEELRVEVIQPRHSARILDHFGKVGLEAECFFCDRVNLCCIKTTDIYSTF